MTITIERLPYVVVTDQESGWSLKGGKLTGDGFQTKEMSHPNGARCTIQITESVTSDEIALRIIGMIFLNAGETTHGAVQKLPAAGDFTDAHTLYRVAQTMVRAWYEATYTTMPKLTVSIPSR